ncbi:hypothetical protein [Gelidibacter salicanalis]|uniref:Porin family protein n=1 Tax=Gelidibacter salicanalis TaxID=291193 RepID=A0A934KY11_9FLAO|nr:hypothetical protein [Gelidibacter salicanalis]MBJ7882443.1 hypothetical protein [Gelidibacter salicanalis]
MKKIFLIAVAFIGGSMMMNAQDIAENAIGLRLGDSDGFGAEVSYQRALGADNRLELDLGIRSGDKYDGFKLAGIYQWVWNIDGGFNWYAGPGAGIANYSYDDDYRLPNRDDSETFVFIAGQVGIEYNFDIPLMLSLDFRPELGFGDDYFGNDDLDFDIALGIRYQF